MRFAPTFTRSFGALFAGAVLAACGGGGGGGNGAPAPPTPQASATPGVQLYVANDNSITVYPAGATGNVAPATKISGSNTGLTTPYGVTVNANGAIFVANANANTITVYAAGANGNVAPTATIGGVDTGLNTPESVALDSSGRIYVANAGLDGFPSITTYAAGANGDAKPVATISGNNTILAFPSSVVLDASGKMYVTLPSLGSNGGIAVYAAGANGNAAPVAVITGSSTGLNGPTGLAFDVAGNLYVANYAHAAGSGQNVTIYAPGPSGNVAPFATIAGANTGLALPRYVAVDLAGKIYVSNQLNSITVYAAGASGNAAPIATISGSSTGLSAPTGIAIH